MHLLSRWPLQSANPHGSVRDILHALGDRGFKVSVSCVHVCVRAPSARNSGILLGLRPLGRARRRLHVCAQTPAVENIGEAAAAAAGELAARALLRALRPRLLRSSGLLIRSR